MEWGNYRTYNLHADSNNILSNEFWQKELSVDLPLSGLLTPILDWSKGLR